MEKNGEPKAEVKEELSTKVKLKTPLKMPDGKVLDELDVDIDKLTMGDLHRLEMEYAAIFPNVTPTNGIYMTDSKYQALVIARINGLVYDNLARLSARDTFQVANRMGRFLAETV
jgi:hypothetical protein